MNRKIPFNKHQNVIGAILTQVMTIIENNHIQKHQIRSHEGFFHQMQNYHMSDTVSIKIK